MGRFLLKNIFIAVGLGSFLYLLNGVFGTLDVLNTQEIISVWIASVLIGAATALHVTRLAFQLVVVIQFAVGITAFTTIAIINEWIVLSVADVLSYAGITFIIMLIIFTIFYLSARFDSRKINKKLSER